MEVGPDGEAKVVVPPAGGFHVAPAGGKGDEDEDEDSPVKVQRSERPTEAAPVDSPFGMIRLGL